MAGRILKAVPTLIVGGLRETAAAGIVAKADLSWLKDDGDGAVPLEPYRELLKAVMRAHGAVPLLQAGQSLRSVSHPILFVLLNTAEPAQLIEKEARLSKFIHSRHRVDIVDLGPTHIVLKHTADSEPPMAEENLASCGQHVVLLEEIGCRGLELRFPAGDNPDRPVYRDGVFDAVDARDGFDAWRFTWESLVPTRRPMAGLDEVLLQDPAGRTLSDESDPVSAVEQTLLSDLGRTWTLAGVADRLGRSKRTLQRQLSDHGRTFSEITFSVRTSEARRLLVTTGLSVTEIGYICGFADTAHFSRSFKKRFEVAPSQWQRV